MTTTTEAPIFPTGVHDIVSNDLGGGFTEFVCSAGDYAGIVAHTDRPAEMRMARGAAYCHAADQRGGMCHAGCYDDDGHTDGCLYEDGDG